VSPRAKARCARPDCDEQMPCRIHPPDKGRTRRSRHERDYDSEHVRRAAALRQAAEAVRAVCVLCRKPIDYRLRSPHPRSFVAHHTTSDKRGPLAPAHRDCNEAEGQPTR
jgi:hypothetical protein